MADRVYLHIGAAKTGTSYLQQMLWRNEEVLAEQGVFLPLGRRRAHFDAVADLRGGIWTDGSLSARWEELVTDVKARPGVALVSEELLCGSPPDVIERVLASLAPVPVHVIVAARDIGRQVPAEWQQSLRARSAMTYDEWFRRLRDEPDRSFWNTQNPVRVHERWGPGLEPGHFHVLTVPQRGAPTTMLWERFCSIFGADPNLATPLDGRQNESLGVLESELLRRFNAQLGPLFPMRDAYIKVVRNHLMRPALQGSPTAARIGVPEEWVDWITGRADELVRDLTALGDQVDVVGSVDDLRAQVEAATVAPDKVSDGELLEAALQAWTRQLQAIEVEVDERIATRVRRREERIRARELEAAAERTLPRRVRRKLGAVKRRVLRRS